MILFKHIPKHLFRCTIDFSKCIGVEKKFSISFSYSRHQDIFKSVGCNLCRNVINGVHLRANKLWHKIEINDTRLTVYEAKNNSDGMRRESKPIYTDYDACPVDFRPWEDNGF